MKAFVGPPTDGAGCAFAAGIDLACCDAAPTVHVLVDAAAWGVVLLASCDEHAPVARAAGKVIDEHGYGPGCAGGECFG